MTDSSAEILAKMLALSSTIQQNEAALREARLTAGRLCVAANEMGVNVTDMASIFGVSRNTIYNWMKNVDDNNN